MGTRQDVLEINGKPYDAVTGKMLASSHSKKHHASSIDGFTPHKIQRLPKARKVAAHSVHAKPAHSSTLMRHAVQKPKISASSSPVAEPIPIESYAQRHKQEDIRFRRAIKIPTNKLVSRFGIIEPTNFTVPKRHEQLVVKSAPAPEPTLAPEPVKHPTTKSHLEASLHRAQSHTAKPPKKAKMHHRVAKKLHVKPKTLRAASATAAFLMLAGFFAYQNATIIAVRVAAARAGISATVPGYTPAGFRLQTHAAKPGQIIIGYKSTTDDRSYQLTQTASAWDSATLVQNYVSNYEYQTATSKGRKVYLYDNNATWVDNGVWYKVESKASLSSDQLQQLIDSI